MLAGVFVVTTALSQVMSNTATAVLMSPIVLTAAVGLGVEPHPLMMALAVAASTAFLTPIGTTTNLMVLAPGNYRFGDYGKAGVPLVGAGEVERARIVGFTALKLALGYALVVSVALVAARHQVVQLYGNDPEVLATAATLILFIAFYQVADDSQATIVGVLRGFKDTRAPMIISLVGYWIIALPIGAWLGFGDYGVYGFW